MKRKNPTNKLFLIVLLLAAVFCLQTEVFADETLAGPQVINKMGSVKNMESTEEMKDYVLPDQSKELNIDFKKLKQKLEFTKKEMNKPKINMEALSLIHEFKEFPDSSKINLTLDSIDIASVLRILAKEGGKNIVLDESVQGYISAELKDVSLNEAMQVILVSEELEARVDGSTIFVASRPVMAKKGLNRKFVKAFKLSNSNAVEVAQILEASVFNKGYNVNESSASSSGGGTMLQALESSNSEDAGAEQIVSSSGQSSLGDKKTIKGKIQEIEPGVGFGDAKILAGEIKIQNTTQKTGNINIANNDGGAIVIPDTRTNSVLIAGLQEDIIIAQEAIKYLDKPLSQVSIEVSLVEITKTDTKNLGLSFSRTSANYNLGFNNYTQNVLHNLDTAIGNQSVMGYDAQGSNRDGFNTALNALIQNNKAKLLANPTILALDNSEALIKITDQVVSKLEVTETQTSVSRDVTLADVGIVLNILPKIGENGSVTMRIRPSITTPLPERIIDTETGAFVTPISTREVIIQDLRVKSGETFAIGGLIKDNDIEKIGKIPFASDLPVFGKLFQTKENVRTKTELVILITPKIVEDNSYEL